MIFIEGKCEAEEFEILGAADKRIMINGGVLDISKADEFHISGSVVFGSVTVEADGYIIYEQ
jgi:hypothetical protein